MINKQKFDRYAADPSAFRADLLVDVDGVARRFGDVMDPWQRADFAALDPGLQRCNGRKPNDDARMRAYLERSRGHSKTTDLAVTCCWALAFSTRPIRGYAFAADRDQAKLLRDAMATVCRLNPWLGEILTVEAHSVTNKATGHPGNGATLTIEASDVGSSYGILPDLIIADELCHWQGDGSLWHSLISSAAKRNNCLLVVISNAGFVDSWQWNARESARTDPAWYFSRLDGPVASWLTPARLEEQRRMLPPIAFSRLWLNQWSSGGGDALSPADIAAAFVSDLSPMTRKEDGWLYVAGLDLGLTRDCSAVVVLAVPSGGTAGRIRLAHNRLWRPTLGQKINLGEVESHVLTLDDLFGLEFVAADPWQAESMMQRLEADSGHRRRNAKRRFGSLPWVRGIQPTGQNLQSQATLVLEGFADHRFQLYDCEPLRRDLLRLRVEEKSYGCRLTSPRDGSGHGDTFSAFALALLISHELAGKKPVVLTALDKRPGQSRAEQAAERFAQRAEAYRQEMSRLFAGGADYEGREEITAFMRLNGR